MSSKTILAALVVLGTLAACAKNDPILPGPREEIRPDADEGFGLVDNAGRPNRTAPVPTGPARVNANWTQRSGTPATRADHPALSPAPRRIWSANIGSGDGSKARITADPVVANGRVFTLDSAATVTAVSTGGKVLWSRNLVPLNDSANDASGGGLAHGDGKLFVTSGFGKLTALDPASGAVIWEQQLRGTGSGSPTVLGEMVYLVAGDDEAWAIDTDTGRVQWRLSAAPDANNILGGPAPALSDKYAVFAFGAGELQGAFRKGGLRLWDAQVAGRRSGLSQALVTDVTGDPLIVGDRIYVGTHSGRLVALKLGNGERIWTAKEGPLSPIWPAGGSLFIISDRNELVRINAEDGTRIWSHKLPFFTKDRPRKKAEIYAHYGPVLAGGQLVVASNDGLIRFFDPASGALRRTVEVPGGATANPVVAGGTLYVVSTNGRLHAFR
ncbi:PQQ-like beta-propeller repeat protein [Roseovarius sp. SCSIO 43702]|uniref:PQQ-like beta-propeller repeat protein n=1 Tax=Roseovarius sp. SCSIO 43702 TaxID=2823043 RepID=UPI002175B883|nr:PQQ-like beta-propeller repeat protein [Roseovarius sp. SCSIO 43702]